MSTRRQTCSAVSASPRPTGRSWKFPVTAAEARGQPPASDARTPDPAEGRGLRGVALGTVGGGLGVPPHAQEPWRGCSRRRGRGQAVCLRKSQMCPQNATCEACPCGGRGGRPGPHTGASAGASRPPAPPLSGINPGKCRGGGAGDLPPHPRLPPPGFHAGGHAETRGASISRDGSVGHYHRGPGFPGDRGIGDSELFAFVPQR